MSIPRKATVTCPRCGHAFEQTFWESINCEIDRDLPAKLISGEFFSVTCPRCGESARVEYTLLYNDLNHGTFVYLVTTEEDYREALRLNDRLPALIPHFRIVRSAAALSEKVTALENGLDDRVIELCRYICLSKVLFSRRDFIYQDSFYHRANGQDEFIFYGDSCKTSIASPPPAFYEAIHSRFHDVLENEVADEPEIDLLWAKDYIEQHMDLLEDA